MSTHTNGASPPADAVHIIKERQRRDQEAARIRDELAETTWEREQEEKRAERLRKLREIFDVAFPELHQLLRVNHPIDEPGIVSTAMLLNVIDPDAPRRTRRRWWCPWRQEVLPRTMKEVAVWHVEDVRVGVDGPYNRYLHLYMDIDNGTVYGAMPHCFHEVIQTEGLADRLDDDVIEAFRKGIEFKLETERELTKEEL